jgi:hypothetical protein
VTSGPGWGRVLGEEELVVVGRGGVGWGCSGVSDVLYLEDRYNIIV